MSRASFGSTTVSQQLTRSTDMEDTFVDSSILSTDSAPASSNDGERASNLGPLSGSGFRRPADDNNDDEDDDDPVGDRVTLAGNKKDRFFPSSRDARRDSVTSILAPHYKKKLAPTIAEDGEADAVGR